MKLYHPKQIYNINFTFSTNYMAKALLSDTRDHSYSAKVTKS